MFARLGNITFDAIKYFKELSSEEGGEWVEIPIIGEKPRLQKVGEKLDIINLKITLHETFCSPEIEMNKLRALMNSKKVLPLIFGNGIFHGHFIIEKISTEQESTTDTGSSLALTATVSLKENPIKIMPKNEKEPIATKYNVDVVIANPPAITTGGSVNRLV